MPIYESNYNPAWQSQWRGMQRGMDTALSSAPTEVIRSGGGKTPEQIQRDAEAIANQARQRDQQTQELENAKRLLQIMPQLKGFASTPEQAQKLMQLGQYLNSVFDKYGKAAQGAQQGIPGPGTSPGQGQRPQYAIPEGGVPLPGGLSRDTGIYAERKPDGGYKITNAGKVRTNAPQAGIPGADQIFNQVIMNAAQAMSEQAKKEGGLTQEKVLDNAVKAYKEAISKTPINEQPEPFEKFYKRFVDTVQGGVPSPEQAGQASFQPGAGPGGMTPYQGDPNPQPAPADSPMMWVTDTEGKRILVPTMEQFDFEGKRGIPEETAAPTTKTSTKKGQKPNLARGEVKYGKRPDGTPVAVGKIGPRPSLDWRQPEGIPEPMVEGGDPWSPNMAGAMRTMEMRPEDQPPPPRTMEATPQDMAGLPEKLSPYEQAYPAKGRGMQGAVNLAQDIHGGMTAFQQNLRDAYGQPGGSAGRRAYSTGSGGDPFWAVEEAGHPMSPNEHIEMLKTLRIDGLADAANGVAGQIGAGKSFRPDESRRNEMIQFIMGNTPIGRRSQPTPVRMPITREDPWSPNQPAQDPWSSNQPRVIRRGTDRATGKTVYQLDNGQIVDESWGVIE